MNRRLASRTLALAAVTTGLAFAGFTTVSNDESQAQDTAANGPLAGFTTQVRATHYLGNRAYKAQHFFKQVRPGVLQGLVVRHLDPDAPVIEAEWAISKAVYNRLPQRDRRHWHPLAPMIDAGRASIPGASEADERKALAGIRGLYAQTLNFSGLDGALPTGPKGVRVVTHLAPGERHHGDSRR
jgi:hypothetical protein